MSRTEPRPLALSVMGLAESLAPVTPLARVQRAWSGAVGPAIAREAEPVSERAGVVTVACRSAVWAQELDLLGPELIERVNEALGDPRVTGLRCVSRPPRITP
jgi:predicted nucleic acid-binding Zn ribbon protein